MLQPRYREVNLGKIQKTLTLLVRSPDTSDPRKFANLAFSKVYRSLIMKNIEEAWTIPELASSEFDTLATL